MAHEAEKTSILAGAFAVGRTRSKTNPLSDTSHRSWTTLTSRVSQRLGLTLLLQAAEVGKHPADSIAIFSATGPVDEASTQAA